MWYRFAAPRFIDFMKQCSTSFSLKFLQNKLHKPLTQHHYANIEKNLLPSPSKRFTLTCHALSTQYETFEYPYPHRSPYITRHHQSLHETKCTEENFVQFSKYAEKKIVSKKKLTMRLFHQLKHLIEEIFELISFNLHSPKACLLGMIKDQLDNKLSLTKKEIIFYLRLLLQTTLQRTQYAYSLFSTTGTGDQIKNLLEQPRYRDIAKLILGTADRAPRYRDLRSFAGGLDEQHFNAAHQAANFRQILDQLLPNRSSESHEYTGIYQL
jgi:hypothetical protein